MLATKSFYAIPYVKARSNKGEKSMMFALGFLTGLLTPVILIRGYVLWVKYQVAKEERGWLKYLHPSRFE
jgi:hypothetical protein